MLLPAYEQAHVLVVGDLMLDRYWHGDTARISPEAPVPVVRIGEAEERPGGAGNVALNITALTAGATVLGLTGDDEAAAALAQCLERGAAICEFQRLADCATITKLRVLSRHQQLLRLDFESPFPAAAADRLQEHYRRLLPQAQVVVLSDYNKGTLAAAGALIDQARRAGKPVVVDPKGADFGRYRGATLITPNLHEFEAVAGYCADDRALEEKGERLRAELALDALLITRSEKGMTLLQSGAPPLHLPARAREVFDVTGAGDTVVAVVAAGLAAGQSLAQATALANLAAGLVVAKLGAASVSVPELQRALREQDGQDQGVVDEDKLIALVQECRAHGERVVMTNGCFDILHAGHVTYLEQARRLGDRLVVAVNDDASVKRLKGAERPVNTLARRMRVLAGLECVDWVVPFNEDTPTRLICRVTPDVLVKGGDNDPAKIPGGDCVRAAGGEVRVMDYVDDCSTTGLINSIRTGSDDVP